MKKFQNIHQDTVANLPRSVNDGVEEVTVTYSEFSNRTDVIAEEVTESFFSFAERCSSPFIRKDKDGPAFCPATFYQAYRRNENAQDCGFLAFDLDGLPADVMAADVLRCVEGVQAFAYSTHSHGLEGKGSRYRVVVAVGTPIPASQYRHVAAHFAKRFVLLGGSVDQSCFSPNQILYFPSVPPERRDSFEFEQQEGVPYCWQVSLTQAETEGRGDCVNNSVSRSAALNGGRCGGDLIPQGERNRDLFRIGAAMRGRNADRGEIMAELAGTNALCCNPPLDDTEVVRIVDSVCRYPAEVGAAEPYTFSGTIRNDAASVTELAIAEMVVRGHAGVFHWLDEVQKWIFLDRESNVWQEDSSGHITRWMLDVLMDYREYAATLIGRGEHDFAQKILTSVKKAEKNSFICGAEKLLTSLHGVHARKGDFDANPFVIGLQGGMCVDLSTLTVRRIDPSDRLTKLAGAEFRDNAACPLWDKSILEWCCGNQELARFLQVWSGYCLSGLTSEQCFLFLFGGGRNGKSVFINILQALLGDYVAVMNPDSLMLKSSSGGANNDIARLVGARLVTSVELQEGRVFHENLIKQLTGGDKINARYLYRESFEFYATLKLMVTGNHKPIVKGSDFGFWRRVLMVPFFANVSNPDASLTKKLLEERSGILNWALEGWRIYQSEGLVVPDVIRKESADYKEEMDFLGQWMRECTTPDSNSEVRGVALYACFKEWAEQNGHNRLNSSAFGRKLAASGVPSRRDARGTIYRGLRLVEMFDV